MTAPARVAAYEVVRAVSSGRADLPHALASARSHLSDERDRALTTEIATGTIRWLAAFDHLIAQFAARPLSRLDPEVVNVLRISIFQLLHLDRVPASAAVNDAVSLTRRAGKRSAAPFVNALLRRVSRERTRLPLPGRPAPDAIEPDDATSRGGPEPPPDDGLDYLSITLSHPRWLASRWLTRYGFDAVEAWARFNNAPAPLTLRANRLRITPSELAEALAGHGVRTTACRFAPDGLTVTNGNPLLTPLADAGLFLVQDEASQLVALAAGVTAGERVLDACASPGGKTTAMAASMANRGLIVATDLRGARVGLLASTVKASAASCVRVVRCNVEQQLPFDAVFDCVLLDAPCSGLGTVRRDPDIKWRRTEADLAALAAAQRVMLDRTADVVRPGGRLVYSTCSTEPEENEDVVQDFVAAHPEFVLTKDTLNQPSLRTVVDRSGFLRTLPFQHQLEGFFAAVLVKSAASR